MARDRFTSGLNQIKDEVLLLGSRVEQASIDAVAALTNRDLALAGRVYREDTLINEKRFAIENAVLVQIATQQPMAHDLRFLAAILEVTTELERMGDYAKGIARVAMRLDGQDVRLPSREYSMMAGHAVGMLHRALTAFVNEDLLLARRIPNDDDQVDALYERIYRMVVTDMIADPSLVDAANLLIWVAHNLERLADRSVNICERTVFICTGELHELETGL